MPRGGKRPGVGARKGNLNALKHGRNSQQVEQFMLALLSMPRLREILAAYYRRQQRTERQATKVVQGDQFTLGPLLQDSRYKNPENHDNSIKES